MFFLSPFVCLAKKLLRSGDFTGQSQAKPFLYPRLWTCIGNRAMSKLLTVCLGDSWRGIGWTLQKETLADEDMRGHICKHSFLNSIPRSLPILIGFDVNCWFFNFGLFSWCSMYVPFVLVHLLVNSNVFLFLYFSPCSSMCFPCFWIIFLSFC